MLDVQVPLDTDFFSEQFCRKGFSLSPAGKPAGIFQDSINVCRNGTDVCEEFQMSFAEKPSLCSRHLGCLLRTVEGSWL